MPEKYYRLLARISIRTKLFIMFLTLIMVTLVMSSYGYYNFALENAVKQYSIDAYQNIRQSNTIINQKFLKILEKSELVIKDKDIYNIFNEINPEDSYDLLKYDRQLNRVLAKYFDANEQIYSYNLITSYYSFGEGFLPYKGFMNSKLHQDIIDGAGQLVWEPTYDFIQMFGQDDLEDCNIDDFRFLFSCGRVLNIFDNSSGAITSLQQGKERPILLINIKESFLSDFYSNIVPNDKMHYFITAQDGSIVSANSDVSKILAQDSDWLSEVLVQKTGILYLKNNKDDIIVCFDTSQITDWTLVSVIRNKDLIPQVEVNIFMTVTRLGSVLILVSLILAYFMSMMVTKPIKKLIAAIKKTGQGDFTSKIPVRGYGELDNLIRHYNNMNDKIQQLINENYEVKLHEKQAQINILNTQLNPHFLYNTLNLVNCIAIENQFPEISKIVVSLSRMLHYTVENNKSLGKLKEELEWLEGYIFIMSTRFDGRFDYGCYVEPELLDYDVPRLFLQPFVENAFIHGFDQMEGGCVLRISGWIEDKCLHFSVRDNGRGMNSERIKEIMEGNYPSVGMKNVHSRLKLMYGDEYGITVQSRVGNGTQIMIRLPDTSNI